MHKTRTEIAEEERQKARLRDIEKAKEVIADAEREVDSHAKAAKGAYGVQRKQHLQEALDLAEKAKESADAAADLANQAIAERQKSKNKSTKDLGLKAVQEAIAARQAANALRKKVEALRKFANS